jgi:hypothetical protein
MTESKENEFTWAGLITVLLCLPLIWTFHVWTGQHFLVHGLPYLNLDPIHLPFWQMFWGGIAFNLAFSRSNIFTKSEDHSLTYMGLVGLATSILSYLVVYAIL